MTMDNFLGCIERLGLLSQLLPHPLNLARLGKRWGIQLMELGHTVSQSCQGFG